MAAATTVRARPVQVKVGCDASGRWITVPNRLAGWWAEAHRAPRVLGVLLMVAGRPQWWDLRG